MCRVYRYSLFMLWSVGIATGVLIVYQYFCIDAKASLLGAFAILISAFLASVTMARSYAQSERPEFNP